MTGDTDSEMYFALIHEQLAAGLSLPEATARVPGACARRSRWPA